MTASRTGLVLFTMAYGFVAALLLFARAEPAVPGEGERLAQIAPATEPWNGKSELGRD